MPRIAVLVHRHDSFEESGYVLGEIAEFWREGGLDVIVVQGPGARIEADVAILHVDTTVVSDDYLSFLEHCPLVINGRVRDISKRATSRHQVQRGDGYMGPVIVKTDRNCRGRRELYYAQRALSSPRTIAREWPMVLDEAWRLAKGVFLSRGGPSLIRDYLIFPSPADVPPGIWSHADLVVEQFLPERHGEQYCVRTWLFFGPEERSARFYANHPIVKSDTIVGHEPLAGVPDELRALRDELGFDYGKFDFAISEGRVVLYDANRTPTLGGLSKARSRSLTGQLAKGIDAFL